MIFPLVFDALGVEPDKEGMLVLECGGKGNMPLFARICNACDIPYVVVHDRDAPRGQAPGRVGAHRQPPDPRGRRAAGARSCSTPDFETVSGVSRAAAAASRGRRGAASTATARCRRRCGMAVEKVVRGGARS